MSQSQPTTTEKFSPRLSATERGRLGGQATAQRHGSIWKRLDAPDFGPLWKSTLAATWPPTCECSEPTGRRARRAPCWGAVSRAKARAPLNNLHAAPTSGAAAPALAPKE